jgi:hypothetical protein
MQQRINALAATDKGAACPATKSSRNGSRAESVQIESYKKELNGLRSQLEQLATDTKSLEPQPGDTAAAAASVALSPEAAVRLVARCRARMIAAIRERGSYDAVALHDLHLIYGALSCPHRRLALFFSRSESNAAAAAAASDGLPALTADISNASTPASEKESLIAMLSTIAHQNDSYDSVFVALSILTRLVSLASAEALLSAESSAACEELCNAALRASRRCLATPHIIPAVVRWQLFAFLSVLLAQRAAAQRFVATLGTDDASATQFLQSAIRGTGASDGDPRSAHKILAIPEALLQFPAQNSGEHVACSDADDKQAQRLKESDYASIAAIEYHSSTLASVQLECVARLCKILPPRIVLPLQGTLRDLMTGAVARARDAHTSSVAELTKQMVEQALRDASAAVGQACSWCGSAAGADKALKVCARCHRTVYCNRDCQTAHWKTAHKVECATHKAECAVQTS